jgi:hypothetical protein
MIYQCTSVSANRRTSAVEPRLANDDRDVVEQAAAIISGKWSGPEDYDDS